MNRAVCEAAARQSLAGLFDFLLPRTCAACHRLLDAGDEGVICGRCWSRARPIADPRCARCGHPAGGYTCAWCALLPPFIRAARSVCWIPGGTAASIVYALKYGGWPGVAAAMAARMTRLSWPPDVIAERAALVPVPLAPVRERARGYNQATRMAEALAPAWRVPVWPRALARTRATRTQTRLTPGERHHNVFGAFRLAEAPAALQSAHVVLVDDVVTTGATLVECARTLFEGGARTISLVTFGRAPMSGDRTA